MAEHEHDEKHRKKRHAGHGHGGGHGGGSHEEHEGAPEWLISFADNVTLMMGFFVILLALNMATPKNAGGSSGESQGAPASSPEALLDAAIAIREAFNNPVNPSSSDPREQELVRRVRARSEEGFSNYPGLKGKQHDTQSIRPSDYHGLCGLVPFADNTHVLDDAGVKAVADIAKQLRGIRLIVEIRGHASAEEAFGKDDEGMRLSFDRVMTVAQVLAENGLDWRQMQLIACADNDRLQARAYNKDAQKSNERVEVVVTQNVMPSYVPSTGPAR